MIFQNGDTILLKNDKSSWINNKFENKLNRNGKVIISINIKIQGIAIFSSAIIRHSKGDF